MNEIKIRRSIREFDKSKKVSEELLKQIIAMGMQAPSAKNQQPWYFVIIDDSMLLSKLKTITIGAQVIEKVNQVILVIKEKAEVLRSNQMAYLDLAACVQNMLLEITHLKLGGCWIGVAPDHERILKVKEIMNLKEYEPFAIIALGYPLTENKYINRFDEKKIFYNGFKHA